MTRAACFVLLAEEQTHVLALWGKDHTSGEIEQVKSACAFIVSDCIESDLNAFEIGQEHVLLQDMLYDLACL